MRNTILLFLAFSIISISCVAQKKISSLSDKSVVKAKSVEYNVNKLEDKVAIENNANKFANVKQQSPNMPINMNLYALDIKVNVKQITEICAAAIPLNALEELSRKEYSGLLITIKSDIKGSQLEVSFFTDGNSVLTLDQLEEIEANIKKSVKISIKPEFNKFIQGSNFLIYDTRILFSSMIEAKRKM